MKAEMRDHYDLAVIGGGVGGMAAAAAAYDAGVKNMAIFECADRLGGVLGQCIHSGFGLHTFGEELTGPEYSARFEAEIKKRGIEVFLSSPVLEMTAGRSFEVYSKDFGRRSISAGAVVLSTGCRERPAGAIGIAGTRPAGIMTAGTAQKYINIDGYMVGRRVVILGSGDIGLIMARRLTLEGAKVLCVCELMPYSNGLNRNIVQCLRDFDIPLCLSTTVTAVEGKERLSGVWLTSVDENRRPTGEKRFVECDTLLLSVGLIPETGLLADAGAELGRNRGISVDDSRQSTVEGIFACGNVVQVHDLVDYVADEGRRAGESAAAWLAGGRPTGESAATEPGSGVSYVVPEKICLPAAEAELSFRVTGVFRKSKIVCRAGGRVIAEKRRPVMLPGEMEKLKLDCSLLRSGDIVSVEVSE